MRIALLQHACSDDGNTNVAKTVDMVRNAVAHGAQLIVTQELFATWYFPQTKDDSHFALAEPVPGPTSTMLCALAKELAVHLAGSLFERCPSGAFHNTSILIAPNGRIVGQYRKMHIPDDPGFYEKHYFTPGQAPHVVHTDTGVVGLQICYDQWFPEAARLTALRGAQVIVYPTAIGWCAHEDATDRARQLDAWQTIQRAHAIASGVFIAAVNRVGVEDDLTFWGGSFVADPFGVIIAQAGEKDEQVLIADCDLSRIDQARQTWPLLRDRRAQTYADLTR